MGNAISEKFVFGKATTATLTTKTGSVTGTAQPLVNYDSYGGGFTKEKSMATTAQSGVTKFGIIRKTAQPIRFAGKLGLGETIKGIKAMFDADEISSFAATGFPDHADMVTEYGKMTVTSMDFNQPEGPGTYTLVLEYGMAPTTFTEVS